MGKKRKSLWSLWFLLLVVAAVVYLISSVFEKSLKERDEQERLNRIPPGWQHLMARENVMSMAMQGDLIWAGSRNGVFKIDWRKREVLEQLDFDRSVSYITSVLVDSRGKLWVGHINGVATWDGREFKYYTVENVLPDNRVNTIIEDRRGRIWIGSWGGATIYDGSSWLTLTREDGLMDNMVNVIMEDSLGSFWFGAYVVPGGALSILTEGSWQYFSTEEGLPNKNITSFLEVEPGTVWVGTGFHTRGGAARFTHHRGIWAMDIVMERNDGLAGEKVRSLFKDNMGRIWFGSEFDGVAVMGGGEIVILTEDDGLSHMEVLSMLQDPDGGIWLGTLEGITVLDYEIVKEIMKQ
jgi:ligand-binding sensor domain-containing protein